MNPPARLSAPAADRWTLSGALDFDTVVRLAVEGETLLRTAAAALENVAESCSLFRRLTSFSNMGTFWYS